MLFRSVVFLQLEPGERSILAYFPSSGKAQKAVDELKSAGFDTVALDRVSRYGVHNDAEINNAIGGRAVSMTGLTFFSAGDSPDDESERVLKGSDPSASGFGSPDYGSAGGRAFLVTVVTNDDKVDQALAIARKHGGDV